ncbi:MAG TPA: MFS transporter [Actinophytocola sp.]|uniref:MFS transporter n=1 Tax=Actinophytocola sp. TaxID=1872138 RepID=UPI002F959ADA
MTSAFKRLQLSAVCANFADGMSLVAFPLLAAAFTSSPLVIGSIAAARSLPWLLTSIHVGVLIDRRGADRLLLGSNTIRVGIFLALAILLLLPANAFLVALAVVAFAAGVLEVVADNSTQTLLPSIVPQEQLPAANARIQLIENAGLNLAGAPVASALMGVHPAAPLIAIATKYSLAAASLRKLLSGTRTRVRPGEAVAVLAGWTHIRRSRALFTLAMTTALINLAMAGSAAILVLYVEQRLRTPTWTYGLLLTAFALGTFLGAAIVPRILGRTSETFVLRSVLLALPAPMLLIALTTDFWPSAAGQLGFGVLEIAWGIVAVSYRQEVVPAGLLGRVNAMYRMMAWGSVPIGAFLAGVFAELMGIMGAYLALTAILCTGWLVSLTIRPEILDRERRPAQPEGQPEPEQEAA